MALDAAQAETNCRSDHWDKDCEAFIEWLLKEQKGPQVVNRKTTLHAELAMILATNRSDIKHVLPYIGVSKLSCIMCSRYICAHYKVMGPKDHYQRHPREGLPWVVLT